MAIETRPTTTESQVSSQAELPPSETYRPLITAAAEYWTSVLTLPDHPRAHDAVSSIQAKLAELLDRSDPSHEGTRPLTFGVGEDPTTDLATRAAAAELNGLGIRRMQGERFTAESLQPPQHTHVVIDPESNTVEVFTEQIEKDEAGHVLSHKTPRKRIYPAPSDAGSAVSE